MRTTSQKVESAFADWLAQHGKRYDLLRLQELLLRFSFDRDGEVLSVSCEPKEVLRLQPNRRYGT